MATRDVVPTEVQEDDLADLRSRLSAGLAEARAGARAEGTGAAAVRRAFARGRVRAAEACERERPGVSPALRSGRPT